MSARRRENITARRVEVLSSIFGANLIVDLRRDELEVLLGDIAEIQDEPEGLSFAVAARTLCNRIGGEGQLRGYMDCLMVGEAPAPRFEKGFDHYVCEGDRITCEADGFTVTARIERDYGYHIDDDDCHNPDQKVTGCNDKQFRQLLRARQEWFDDEWFYGGVVLEVSRNGVTLDNHAASLWGIECNYPYTGDPKDPNAYLLEVANELLPEALERGRKVLAQLCRCDD